MKLFFAGGEHIRTSNSLIRKRILVSYFNTRKQKDIEPYRERAKEIFLDSGAFTAFTKNIEISIEEYIDYLLETKGKWDYIAGLDVIGNAEETKKHCDKMKEAGLNPIPTFHFGEDYSFLEDYCKNYNYIALGGVAQLRTYPRVSAWLDSCFSKIKNYWPKKVHGFAITGERYMKRYPFYSVDSTSWLAGGKFNQVMGIKDGSIYRPLHYEKRNEKNIEYFLKLENEVTKLWEKRGIIWE